MNKIYKVMYSKVKQCCVVVSEIAKSHGRHTKSSVAKSSAALTAGVLIALGSFSFVGMPVAQAADGDTGESNLRNNDFVGANDHYWYYDDKANKWIEETYSDWLIKHRNRKDLPNINGAGAKGTGSIAAGLYAQAGMQSVTIGNRNAGASRGSVFIGEHSGYNDGNNNISKGETNHYVTSVGFQSDATGWGSIAIGSNALAENSETNRTITDEDLTREANTTNNKNDDVYGIKTNPTIKGASVALGYSAHSKDGNIAIGAYSDATSTDKNDSYVSVGNANLKRRITNVADGASVSDVATVGQLQALSKELGGYKAGFGIQIDPESTDKTKNTISVKHNLGTGYADTDATGLILGGSLQNRDVAKEYGTATASSVIVGAQNALASNDNSVVVGGLDNVASGATSVVIGGDNNNAAGNQSAVFGGRDNKAAGVASTASGGIMNAAVGQQATAIGGSQNYVLGANATAVGGLGRDYANGEVVYDSAVRGGSSVGIAGGSTGENAIGALAAGHQAVVTTENGTAIGYQATTDEANTIAFGHDAGDVSGYTIKWKQLPPNQINADGTTNDYTQAPESVTENKYTTAAYNRLVKVADGQDDHDVVVMEQLKQYAEKDASNLGNNIKVYKTDENGNVQLDGNKQPVEDTGATTTAQKNSKDAWGKALGAEPFTTGTPAAATNASTSDQLVTGKTLYNYDAPVAETGKNLNYVSANNTTGQNLNALDAQVADNASKLNDKTHNIKYYSVNDKKSSTQETLPTVKGLLADNSDNKGAKGMGSLASGFSTEADGIASTVAGSYSGVINQNGNSGLDFRGAAALSYGTFNVNQNTADTAATKTYSGVANSIVGQANMTTDSNAAIIYGAGNTVTNSYRPIDPKKAGAILDNVSNPTNLGKAMQDAVKDSGGQVMVMGGGNNVESAYMSQVVGVGNTVKGNQVKNTEGEWATDTSDTAIKDYDSEKSSQYNYVDGFNNEVINGKHDYIIGANNKLDGDSYDDNNAKPIKRSNKSNVVIGDNHALTGKKNNVIIGSADTEGTLTRASDAVIIGHNANATSDTGADNAVAIGLSAKAGGGNAVTIGVNTSAGENSITIGSESHAISGSNIAIGRSAQVYGYEITNAVALGQEANAKVADGVAIGSGSEATVTGKSTEGYDPTTGQTSTDTTGTWQATKAAVSIGKADGTVTRQINGVAAGTNDTDAVNVAQLKKLEGMKANVDASNIGKNLKGADGKTAAADAEKTTNENAWGEALGTGTVTKDSKQLVTGSTVYNEVRPSKDGKYVKMSQTTGENLLNLDSQVQTNTDKLSDVDSRSVKYDTKTVNDKTVVDNTKITLAGEGGTTITNLKDGVNANDAATMGQLNDRISGVTYKAGDGIKYGTDADNNKTISVNKGDGLKFTEDHKLAVNTGKHLSVNTDGQIDVGDNGTVAENDGNLVTGDTVYKALNGGMTKIVIGTPGENGKDGAPGTIGLVGPAGADGKNAEVDITIQQGKDEESKGVKGANGVDGQDGITRIVYKDAAGDHQVATMEDGLKFAGDDGQKDANKVIAKKLNNIVDIIGGAKGDLTEGNIGVNNDSGKLKIQLAQELTGITSISGSTGSNGAKITLDTNDQNISVNGGKITDVASGLSTNDGSYNAKDANNAANISDVNSMISKAVTDAKGETQQNLDKKANVDASNIGTKLKGADGKTAATEDEQKANLDKWGEAIGTGEVKDGSKQLVTGNTVYNAVKDKADKSYVDTQLNTKANTDGSNIDADKFSKKVAIGNINDSDERAVSGKTVNEAIQTINGNIDGKANKNLDNIDNAGKNVIKDQARAAVTIDNKGLNTNVVATQDDKNHTTTYTINVEGNGKVAAKDTGLISGDTIYKELRPATDGNYIKTTNTTAQNLTSLDTQVRATHDLINSDGKTIKIGGSDAATKIDVNGKDGKGRVITGVVSDANDPNSAANVGYVNGLTAANTQQIYRDMNNAYGRLNNNINKAAAGSNALAALHPLDYDPDDKADFAVGYGHYRNANAAAVGAFYHPNENTMVNVGVSLGNGDPGFNAGVSFKVGRGGAGREAMSKTEMAKVINSQSKEIDALKKDNADKDKRIDALEQKMAEILAKLDKNGK